MLETTLVALRFLATIGQAIMLATLLFARTFIVEGSVGFSDLSQEQQNNLVLQFTIVTSVGLGCLLFEWLGMVFGISIFIRSINVFHFLLHLIGTVALLVFYLDEYPSTSILPLVAVVGGLPFLAEVWAYVMVFGLKKQIY
uniref:Transmembrane protein 107 n=1 Tax=Chromera velia CCMP2878 TaxID=1169474 RepID=A0A0G4IA10_9ALVE|mmetsp:Transcript_22133/g.43892  ORF Transcript_22133/g.43892 Transcript_22133/m.43892 type:complete len:141 (-) Transcript_22133:392-814(-)|eukprot:Cvel_12414.t1-p1 / transcript=Cvel_12414.t1 / gene=Cvel_12414 / organism=Chromera_velia_CCMP2878 / gene_product=Transmembrane protein 107, putative / transcript_product=Transmembrane protein 107, putative / location=Cvel_scaffold812:19742-22784(+) / protein_length=140 / sequence_SO=supercontig / SO=protein_coding / is_pseudo=false